VSEPLKEAQQPVFPPDATPLGASKPSIQGLVGVSGNIEFEKLESSELKQVAVVAQALDNQWVPRATLARMLKRGQRLADVSKERQTLARAEYIRSLVNAEQVIINRSFIYHSSIIQQDYLKQNDHRLAFKDLLAHGVIVPYLYREASPVEQPSNVSVTDRAFTEWGRICQETRTKCVRLAWDDAENMRQTRLLVGRFAAWLQTVNRVPQDGNVDLFLFDLDVPRERLGELTECLKQVGRWAIDTDVISRETFYKQFVLVDGTDPTEGTYDRDKQFSGELKQLADLSYNTNLPDALGRYALTPIDSLPRTALQELAVTVQTQGGIIAPAELKKLLQNQVFSLIQGGAFLKGMEHLSLRDVTDIRATQEWLAYMEDLRGLLSSPLEFATRAQTVYDRYIQLAEVMTRFASARYGTNLLERWTPTITLAVSFGGAVLSAVAEPVATRIAGLPPGLAGRITYNFVGNVGQDIATVVARLIIGGVAEKRAQAALETSVDFMKTRVSDAKSLWEDLKGELGATATAGALLQASQDVYDPTINFSQDIALV